MTRPYTKWTPEDMATLQAMLATHSTKDIAKHFGTTPKAVTQYLRRQRQRQRPITHVPRRWTDKEEQYVATHYGIKPTRLIARYLKRTIAAVRIKAEKIGATENRTHSSAVMMTGHDVATWLGVSRDTVGTWWNDKGLPYHVYGNRYLAYESEVLEWLRTNANALRLTRDNVEPRLQRLYDAVLREYYTDDELEALDVPALTPRRWKWTASRTAGVALPTAIVIGRHGHGNGGPARQSRQTYYRKSEVWAWAYAFAYIIPDDVKHPDIADVVLAWQSHYVANAELYSHLPQTTVSKWYKSKGFPRQVKHRAYYDRTAVVAWCKAHGYAGIARALYRGVPLCYDDVIRDRERRHA